MHGRRSVAGMSARLVRRRFGSVTMYESKRLLLEARQHGVEVRHGVRRIGGKRQPPSSFGGHQPRQRFVHRGAESHAAEAQSLLQECLNLCRRRGRAGSRAARPLEQAYADTGCDGNCGPGRRPPVRQPYDQFLVPVRQHNRNSGSS